MTCLPLYTVFAVCFGGGSSVSNQIKILEKLQFLGRVPDSARPNLRFGRPRPSGPRVEGAEWAEWAKLEGPNVPSRIWCVGMSEGRMPRGRMGRVQMSDSDGPSGGVRVANSAGPNGRMVEGRTAGSVGPNFECPNDLGRGPNESGPRADSRVRPRMAVTWTGRTRRRVWQQRRKMFRF